MCSHIPMTKIHPSSSSSSSSPSSSSSSSCSSRRETLTLWMKSLVMNGNGCTAFNSDGKLVYRVDNYDYKCSNEVFLMDDSGKTLAKILRKKLRVFGRWEGYRCNDSVIEESKPWFQVRKSCMVLNGGKAYEHIVRVNCGSINPLSYRILGSENKSEYKVIDMAGELVAEVLKKYTASGVSLGDDVLTLVTEPNVDQLLIMGLVIVCGLINHTL